MRNNQGIVRIPQISNYRKLLEGQKSKTVSPDPSGFGSSCIKEKHQWGLPTAISNHRGDTTNIRRLPQGRQRGRGTLWLLPSSSPILTLYAIDQIQAQASWQESGKFSYDYTEHFRAGIRQGRDKAIDHRLAGPEPQYTVPRCQKVSLEICK